MDLALQLSSTLIYTCINSVARARKSIQVWLLAHWALLNLGTPRYEQTRQMTGFVFLQNLTLDRFCFNLCCNGFSVATR